MREVAGFDYERALHVQSRWPLVEVLAAYQDILKEHALRGYHHDVIYHAIMFPHYTKKDRKKIPKRPPILRPDVTSS